MNENCPVCSSVMRPSHCAWVFCCGECGFLQSTLAFLGKQGHEEKIDEDARERALSAVRHDNFEDILMRLADGKSLSGKSILDVGCAHGWFLDHALRRGMSTFGIEPDSAVIGRRLDWPHRVWNGFFPEVLPDDALFDCIIFNDVFEHLPDVGAALDAVKKYLRPDGRLVINLPSQKGFFYRLSDVLSRAGICGPFERMWQKGLPSPHISYFSPEQLKRLCARHGFSEEKRFSLPSLGWNGLWDRIRSCSSNPLWVDAGIWAGCVALVPVLRLLPPDISVQVFTLERTSAAQPAA
jgi:SAM-dependent methyltransferase